MTRSYVEAKALVATLLEQRTEFQAIVARLMTEYKFGQYDAIQLAASERDAFHARVTAFAAAQAVAPGDTKVDTTPAVAPAVVVLDAPMAAVEDLNDWSGAQAEEDARMTAAASLAGKTTTSELTSEVCLTVDTSSQLTPEAVAPIIDGRPAPSARDIAAKNIAQGSYVIFFPRGQKGTKEPNWQNEATRDMAVVERKVANDPYMNVGLVGKPDGNWYFDDDQNILAEYETAFGKIPTSRNRSVSGGTHLIFKQNDLSRAMGNIGGKNENDGETWSARVHNKYIVAAGSSAHPNNDPSLPEKFYEKIDDAEPIEAPASFLEFLKAKHAANPKKQSSPTSAPEGGIPEGGRNNWLATQAAALRGRGLSADVIDVALQEQNEKFCTPPLGKEEVSAIARSFGNYPAGRPNEIALDGSTARGAAVAAAPAQSVDAPQIDMSEAATRPVFPHWVMEGTSLYENLVKPAVETSSKYPELIFIPAVQVMLNHLSMQITVGTQPAIFNMFVGLVSEPGEFFKSSCCELGHRLFNNMGVLISSGRDLKAAEGRTIIGAAGSSEGFGLQMQKIDANRAILFNDELGKLVGKVGIENSTFSHDLLSWYESRDFCNGTSDPKKFFHFNPQTYCFGWQWCTTSRGFNRHWPKLAGVVSGLEDRMFFVVAPEKPRPTTPFQDPPLLSAAMMVKKVIDKATTQKNYEFWDFAKYAEMVSGMLARSMALVQSLSLYFAVDLGRTVIDEDCVKRAIALVQYREQTARFLQPIEADNEEGRTQKEILRELRQNRGKMPYRDLCNAMDYTRLGLFKWGRAYQGLVHEGLVFEFPEQRTAGKRATRMVGLARMEE